MQGKCAGILAPADLYDGVLPTDGIRTSVQLIGRGESTSKLSIPIDVLWVDGISDAHLGSDILRPLIHATVNSGVTVAVDHSWCDMHTGSINDHRVSESTSERGAQVATHCHNLSLLDQEVCVIQDAAVGDSPHCCVFHQQRLWR